MEKFHISLDGYEKNNFGTEVLAARNGKFIGYLVISDTLKEDAKSAISQIKKQGIATIMLTGDAQDSADAVAQATGIDEVHARLLPQDKLSELNSIRNVVFMTSSMEAIPQALAIAKSTSSISWQNVIFALVIKILVMILGLCGFASMWMAVFADTGVAMLCVLNSIRILYKKS